MPIDPQLLEILACPDTHHAPLDFDAAAQTLTCTECGRIFEIRDDIPVLLLSEARGEVPDKIRGEAPDKIRDKVPDQVRDKARGEVPDKTRDAARDAPLAEGER